MEYLWRSDRKKHPSRADEPHAAPRTRSYRRQARRRHRRSRPDGALAKPGVRGPLSACACSQFADSSAIRSGGARNTATRALDAAGVSWVEASLGGGMMAVSAAVSAGLAIAALAHRVAPAGVVEVGEKLGLPPLPSSEIVLHSTLSDAHSRGALWTLAAAFREHRAPTS